MNPLVCVHCRTLVCFSSDGVGVKAWCACDVRRWGDYAPYPQAWVYAARPRYS